MSDVKIRVRGVDPELHAELEDPNTWTVNLNTPTTLEDWAKLARAILRAHAKQVRKDNPVTDRCPGCGTQGAFYIDAEGNTICNDRFCPDCGLPLTGEP